MNILQYRLILILSLLSLKGHAILSPDAYNFTYLTVDNGLAQNSVDDIYKDSRGFMWFATWNGLNRYDGYRFIRYDLNSGDNSLNSPLVHVLLEDNFQTLWVGTEEGLNRIDIYSGELFDNEFANFNTNPVFSSPINTLIKDTKGRIWIGYNFGLAVLTLDKEGKTAVINILEKGKEAEAISLCQDEDSTIWVGYRNGQMHCVKELSEDTFEISNAPKVLNNKNYGEILTFFSERDDLWIGTFTGLLRYNRNTGLVKQYVNNPTDIHSITQNYIKDITCDKDGNLLIATYKGINIFDKQTAHFLQITAEPDTPGHLNNNSVNSLYADSSGIVWIGTAKGGINKMIPRDVIFDIYRHNKQVSSSLSSTPVNALFEDSFRNLWVGTVENGLNKKVRHTNDFVHYKYKPGEPHSLSHNAVCFITEGGGYLWIATWGGGLNRMKLSEEGYFCREPEFVRKGSISSPFIGWVTYDEEANGLWLATIAGLDFYDLETEHVFPVLNKLSEDRPGLPVLSLCLDTSRRLWIGTSFCLYCIHLNNSDIKNERIDIEKCRLSSSVKKYPQNEKINCIFEAADQSIYIGTFGNGLYQLSGREDNKYVFKNYNTDNGLSDNTVYAIEEDKQGCLWLSTDHGMTAFYPDKKQAITFYTTDGLLNNQFYWVASCRTSDGKLLFGNVDGYVEFDPVSAKPDTVNLKTTIVNLFLYNHVINYKVSGNKWKVKEQNKALSIEFSALYYDAPEKIRYAYRLEGFDTGWTEVDANRRFVTYTNLTAGNYIFKVKCSNPDGEWSDAITELQIQVIPPFYKEKWFLGLVIAIVFYLLYFFNERRIKKLHHQQELLKLMVKERTEKIEAQKDELIVQKGELEESERRLEQVTQDKINFFTNITHEFKTPLTLILGPIEQALKLSQNPKVIAQLMLVRNNSKYLLSLVNQLMDFRKADAGIMKVNKKVGNFPEFVRTLLVPFSIQAAERGICIEERFRMSQSDFSFDCDLMQKVLVNLISNAVKFTPANGHIRLSAALLASKHKEAQQYLYISLSDTGVGITNEVKMHIFERFYQGDNQDSYPVYGQSGTGIGLYLCKQIIELLEGTICVKDNPRGGTVFRIVLPVTIAEICEKQEKQKYLLPNVPDVSNVKYMEEESSDLDKPLLLIAEDNVEMRIFIRSVLGDCFRIIEAPEGETALNKTLKYLPDFIITDIMMPVMDGLEFCKKVKNNFSTSHIPVLLLTAKTTTDVRIDGYKAGANGYIAKPFEAELLQARIHNMLEGRRRLHKAFGNSLDVKELNIGEDSGDRKFLDKLMKIIDENYTDASFDVAELIEKMNVSKSLLHKKLQSLVGQSAVKIIRFYRLTRAKEMIESAAGKKMNISEIAYSVGFNDPKYFTRCFSKYYGMTPSESNEK